MSNMRATPHPSTPPPPQGERLFHLQHKSSSRCATDLEFIWSAGSRALQLCCLLKPRRPSSLSGSASRTGSHQGKCVSVGGGLADGTAALITLGQRSSADLFVNAQSGWIYSEIDSPRSP